MEDNTTIISQKQEKRNWRSIVLNLLAVSVGVVSFGLAPLIADAQDTTQANYKYVGQVPQVQERFLYSSHASNGYSANVSENIGDYVQSSLQDISLTLKTGQYNQQAGEKISKEFGMGYKLSNGTMLYKQPSLIRLDGRLIGMKAEFIMDGFNQHIQVGIFKQSQNHSHAPGKLATLLDLGLLNNFYLTYTTAQYEGIKSIDGAECAVFKLGYQPNMQDTSFRIVWIDTKEHLVRRREEHREDGTLRAVYSYRNPVLISGVWIPTEVDTTNAQGELVGATYIQNTRLNTGITDASFH